MSTFPDEPNVYDTIADYLPPSDRYSVLAIDRFAFDSTTHQGSFESSLRKGTLAVVSGKLAKQSPEAMKVRTPAAVLGVRGTEFLVRTGDAKD